MVQKSALSPSRITLHHGDCIEVMRGMADASVDAVVTDPPYHLGPMARRLASADADDIERNFTKKVPGQGVSPYQKMARGFMGKQWDGGDIAFRPELWADVLRVLKPGGHLIAFSGTRTYHRMACAIEDAGFEIRDQIGWLYGSGFPKSHNLPGGLGTALKPAWEPIVLARKPLIGTVAANVAAHGTGALNIDGCRIEAGDGDYDHPGNLAKRPMARNSFQAAINGDLKVTQAPPNPAGRWPANVTHDGSDEVLEAFGAFGDRGAAAPVRGTEPSAAIKNAYNDRARVPGAFHGDTGTAARFFFSAKASREERGEGNTHPTVKPLALMQWLCRLVTPPGGTVLDPFAGSGSTLIAADREGFNAIGIEREAEYCEIARRRLSTDAPLFAEVA